MKSIEATLTKSDRDAPFRMVPPDNDPLPKITRLAVEIDESGEYVEREVPSFRVVGRGVLPMLRRKVA
jgi:hypothetical protein